MRNLFTVILLFLYINLDNAKTLTKLNIIDMSNMELLNIINNDPILHTIILVESDNRNIAGKTGDIGILQITKIYVKDVNRILGYNKYKSKDRWNINKSIEMYYIYQNHYNPNYNFEQACVVHHGITSNNEKIRYLNRCKLKLMQLILTNCSPEHRNLIFDYIASKTTINHNIIQINSKKNNKDITINDSKALLSINISPRLINIPKEISNLIKELL